MKRSVWASIVLVIGCLFAVTALVTLAPEEADNVLPSVLPSARESARDEETNQYVSFELAGYLPYDEEYYLEVTSFVQQYGGLDCMVVQITSEDQRTAFNEAFSQYGIEVPEHDFEESFLLVSGECELGSITFGSSDSEDRTVSDLSICFNGCLVGDRLFLYTCEKVYLQRGANPVRVT